ncbi:MAG: ABC transporter ATP-binding protein/permease [Neisseria sp.]|nr:ABC transporter ATP-binding protein/permease [Neisseria sp.]
MHTLKLFFQLAKPFWYARSQWREWLLLTAVIACSLAFVRVSVWVTEWNKTFYDALAAFNGAIMPRLIAEFSLYIVLITFFVVLGNFWRKKLIFRWRQHLSHQFSQRWLDAHQHYRLQLSNEPDNPDQRIAEDAFWLAEKSIDLFKYFILNAAKLGAFIAVLWQLSGVQTFSAFGYSFEIYGYLVWVALIYSLLCTLFTHFIGRKLQALNINRQHREADYRATLLRIRDHSEQIAFLNGETVEQKRLENRFAAIAHNWQQLIWRELKLESFSAAYLRVSMFIPILATLPMYLAKTMTFGDMMAARSAFSNVQDGFGWFMDYYKRIIEWAAVVQRLAQFDHALRNLPSADGNVQQQTSENILKINQLSVHTQNQQVLLHPISFALKTGESILLDGKSGIGKSSLLRVLAGLSPYYTGQFTCHANALFLPQNPYLPHDTLLANLAYPNAALPDEETALHLLKQVGLAQLKNQLNQQEEWHKILSGGEQQRLSLARALWQKPAILFLDEATNRLDDEAASELVNVLQQELANTAFVFITHQQHIKNRISQRIQLEDYAAKVQTAAQNPTR